MTTEERPPIIDMHMHARLVNERGPGGQPGPRPCAPRPCDSGPPVVYPEGGILGATLAAMDRHNIVLGFLSDSDEHLAVWMEAAPGRFLPSPRIPPKLGDSTLQDVQSLRRAYEDGRFKGIGEIAAQYLGIAPNDPLLGPYFSLAEELDLPVLIHTLGIGAPMPTFRVGVGNPLLLEDVAARHPRLRLFVENAGYPFLDEMIALMTQYPQVYVDVSTITWLIPRSAFYRHLRGLVDAGLGNRIMFGSDQMEWPEVIDLAIDAIESANFLTSEQKRDIFYNNAARFLRLDTSAR